MSGTKINVNQAQGLTDADVASANKDGSAGTASMRTLGTGSLQACAGNDSRLSNSRTPTSHASTHEWGGSDPIGVFQQNYLLNGGFSRASQQVPSTYTTVPSDKYGPDMWRCCSQSASLQYVRTDNAGVLPTGLSTRYNGQFQQVTNAGKYLICQPIEGVDTLALVGQNVTFQVYLSCTSTIAFRLGLICLNSSGTIDVIPANIVPTTWGANSTDPTLGTNLVYTAPVSIPSGANGSISGNALTCSLTNTFQLFAATFTIPSGTKNIIPAIWTDAQAGAGTSGLTISQAALYLGSSCQQWQPVIEDSNLNLIQRYIRTSYENNVAPGTNVGAGGSNVTVTYATPALRLYFPFAPPMRVAPTVTIYDSAGNPGACSYFTTGWNNNNTNVLTANVTSKSMVVDTYPTSGSIVAYDYVALAYL